jgi:hypothetical protein
LNKENGNLDGLMMRETNEQAKAQGESPRQYDQMKLYGGSVGCEFKPNSLMTVVGYEGLNSRKYLLVPTEPAKIVKTFGNESADYTYGLKAGLTSNLKLGDALKIPRCGGIFGPECNYVSLMAPSKSIEMVKTLGRDSIETESKKFSWRDVYRNLFKRNQ